MPSLQWAHLLPQPRSLSHAHAMLRQAFRFQFAASVVGDRAARNHDSSSTGTLGRIRGLSTQSVALAESGGACPPQDATADLRGHRVRKNWSSRQRWWGAQDSAWKTRCRWALISRIGITPMGKTNPRTEVLRSQYSARRAWRTARGPWGRQN